MSQESKIEAGAADKRKSLLDLLRAERGLQKADSDRIARVTGGSPAPLSFAQQRMWFIDQFQPRSAAYNISVIRPYGALRLEALERTLDEIVRRHEVLRTRFIVVEGEPRQEVLPPYHVNVQVHDLQEFDKEQREIQVRRLAQEQAAQPFDIPQGPHLAVHLFRLEPENHVLLLSLHHIISDEWSTDVFLRELREIYQAYVRGGESPLPELPIQYSDFAAWQRDRLEGDALQKQVAYWKDQLADAPALLEMPTDRPRPPVQRFEGRSKLFSLPLHLMENLKAVGNEENATLFMVLLAAFNVLLHRYSRQNDIVVGTPIANRTRPEIERLIGPVANTLALRTDLSGLPTFREVLRRIKEVTLGAYAHQDLPFEKLVEELQPDRNLSYSPIFQVLFILQNLSARSVEDAAGKLTAPFRVDTGTSKFDLTVLLAEEVDGLSGYVEYDTMLYDGTSIDRMIGHMQCLLQGIVDDPDGPIRSLPILPPDEQQQIVGDWNATTAGYEDDQCAQQLFESQVERTPDAFAVEFIGSKLTYRELNERANQLAWFLKQQGVGPEIRVGICMERSLEVVVALLGVLKAGGVHTPLDPGYPKERLGFMLSDAQMQIVLTQTSMQEVLPKHELPTLLLDVEWSRVEAFATNNPSIETKPDNLAYVVYTSGSTGRPKGVAMRHRTLANLFQWQLKRYRNNPVARTLQFTSFSFDVSVQEILNTLCTGGVLIMMPEELRREPLRAAEFLIENEIERLYLPFTALHLLCEGFEAIDRYPATLQEIVSTGEQMRLTEPIRRSLAKVSGLVLHNQYGPTETHFATGFSLKGDPHAWPTLPLVGRPLDNTRIYVLDEYYQAVPIGVAGEVYIGGVPIARGYLERPRQNAEKFLPDPYCQEPSERIYRTGDLARFCADGNLEYLGRLDHQVKIRGYRIELGEVEATLVKNLEVQSAVVVPSQDASGTNRLLAFVIPREGLTPTVTDLRQYLKEKLPEYMVPTTIVISETLPISPNGKIDRKALSVPDSSRPEIEEDYVAAQTEFEMVLAKIWCEVLEIERVGVDDNFFDLGGHSLLATQVFSRIAEAMHVRLRLRRLFESPTIRELAVVVQEEVECAAAG